MILIIAWGNNLRQDDGAGLALAQQLAGLLQQRGIAVRQLAVQQLVPELAADIAGEKVKTVVFVDTRLTTSVEAVPQVAISPLVAQESTASLGHHLEAATLLLYAARLYGQSPPAWLLTVPGVAFSYGEVFSTGTSKALSNAPVVLEQWLNEIVARFPQPDDKG